MEGAYVRKAVDRAAGAEVEAEPTVSGAGPMVREGVPLTITPSPDKHRLDAQVAMGTGRNGIDPKVATRMRRGAAGCAAWNSATFLGALATFPESSQVLASKP